MTTEETADAVLAALERALKRRGGATGETLRNAVLGALREAESAMRPDLVSTPEVAEMLGVPRARASAVANRPSFPAPYIAAGIGRLWVRWHIESWMRAVAAEGGAWEHNGQYRKGLDPEKVRERMRKDGVPEWQR